MIGPFEDCPVCGGTVEKAERCDSCGLPLKPFLEPTPEEMSAYWRGVQSALEAFRSV
jgi:hypothetical protein